MLIPLGPEDSVVRRHPVVCYTLAALNVLVYLATTATFDEEQWAGSLVDSARELEAYVAAHPYLEVPDEIGGIPPLAEAVEETLAEAEPRRAPPEGIRKLEQGMLDGIVHDVVETWQERPAWTFGFVPARPSILTLVTSMFMHAGFMHLAGNMLFLYISGPLLEDLYGRPLFLAMYVLSGFLGSGLHLLRAPGSWVPVVGASGAIAGLMGAFLVRLTTRRIRFLFFGWFFFRIVRFTFSVPAWLVIPFWFAEDFVVGAGDVEASGIAHLVHVGGFVFGAFAAFLVKLFAIESRYIHPAIEAATGSARHPSFVAAVEARARQDLVLARQEIDAALADEPGDVDALLESYAIALGEGDMAAAGATATRLLERYREEGEVELAERLLADAGARLGESMPPALREAGTSFLEEQGKPEAARRFAARAPGRAAMAATGLLHLYRRAEEALAKGDRAGAGALYRQALALPDCNDSWRERIERALEGMEERPWDGGERSA